MTEKLLKNLKELAESIDKYAPELARKIKDPAILISASKYYSALERLARE